MADNEKEVEITEDENKPLDFNIEDVKIEYGLTINAKNYESVRVGGSVTVVAEKKCKTVSERDQLLKDMIKEAGSKAFTVVEKKAQIVRADIEKKKGVLGYK